MGVLREMAAAIEFEHFEDPDAELLRRCKAGGREAEQCFKALMDRHATSIERRAARILGNDSDAQDIVQEVFVSVHRFLHRYEPDRPFQHWLSVVTLNACRLELRRRSSRNRRHDAFQREAASDSLDAFPPDPILRQWLVSGLAELREPTRTCILLRIIEGLSYKEIAERQNASLPAVKMRVSRGLRELRDRFELESRGVDRASRPPQPCTAASDQMHAA